MTAGDEIVRRTWKEQFIKGGDFELGICKALAAGVLPNSAGPPSPSRRQRRKNSRADAAAPAGSIYLKFEPDSHTYDGRFANNGWLQETPRPADEAGLGQRRADLGQGRRGLGDLKTGDVIKIDGGGRWIEVAAIHAGPAGGRDQPARWVTAAPRRATSATARIQRLRHAHDATPYVAQRRQSQQNRPDLHARRSRTHHHIIDKVGMEGREPRVGGKGESGLIVREATLAEYKENPDAPHENSNGRSRLQLFDSLKYQRPPRLGHGRRHEHLHRLQRLRGGVPGGEQYPGRRQGPGRYHREMNWLRIDRYFKAIPKTPKELDVACLPADDVPALRERAVRAGLPGRGDRARHRRPEHDGVQPLHRHAVLLEQLPVQGAPLQLLRLARQDPRGTHWASRTRRCPTCSRSSRSTRSSRWCSTPKSPSACAA